MLDEERVAVVRDREKGWERIDVPRSVMCRFVGLHDQCYYSIYKALSLHKSHVTDMNRSCGAMEPDLNASITPWQTPGGLGLEGTPLRLLGRQGLYHSDFTNSWPHVTYTYKLWPSGPRKSHPAQSISFQTPSRAKTSRK